VKLRFCQILPTHPLRTKVTSVLVVLILSFSPSFCWSWGREGHQIIARIAENDLDETTKVMIQSLIGNNHLYSIASWADDIRRDRPDTAPWHYVDIPFGTTYDSQRDCALPHSCVVLKISDFVKVLTDRQASREDRTEALKFIVHFVGDIHQPMHAALEARGGNDVPVRFLEAERCGAYACNLHAVWDTSMIQHAGMSPDEYAQHEEALIRTERLDTQKIGSPEQWANESLKLAEAAWVPEATDLDERYYSQQIKVVDRQMALGGMRLAKLLNDTIGKMTPRDFSSSIQRSVAEQGLLSSQNAAQGSTSSVKVWVNTRSDAYDCSDTRLFSTDWNLRQGDLRSADRELHTYRP